MKLEERLLLLSLVIYFWPMLVSFTYLLARWRLIPKKISFWFVSVLTGYLLMFGIPLLFLFSIKNIVGADSLLRALEKPELEGFVAYYWLIMAIVALVLAVSPVISTHVIFRKKYLSVRNRG